MNRLLLVASLVVAASGTAQAGTYLGLGIGTSPADSGDTGRIHSDGRSGKLVIGNSFGRLAVEGTISRFAMNFDTSAGPTKSFGDAYQAAIALKLNFPLGNNFEAYGKAGLHHMWLDTGIAENDTAGNGLLLGGGFEYKLNLGVGGGALFVDYQITDAKLEGDKFTFDNTRTRTWTLGLTVGI